MSLALMPRMATAARAVVWAAVRERRVAALIAKVPEVVGTCRAGKKCPKNPDYDHLLEQDQGDGQGNAENWEVHLGRQ